MQLAAALEQLGDDSAVVAHRAGDRNLIACLLYTAIAEQVSLTSPAVSSRIHKLETDGIISGYTVTLNRPADRMYAVSYTHLTHGFSVRDLSFIF